jgi:hypothetical protein
MKTMEDLPGCFRDSQELAPDEDDHSEAGDDYDILTCGALKVNISGGTVASYFVGDRYCRRGAEIYLNALLSPLEMVYDRPEYRRALEGRQYAFALRYGKLLDDAAVP